MNAVDTNVLVYVCDQSDPTRQRIAKDTLRGLGGGILLWQVACEFIAASRKLAHFGFTNVDAWDYLAGFTESLTLTLPGPGVLQRAQTLHVEQQWSFWDAMMVAACLDAGVTRLYSEDLPGQAPPEGLEIVNPFT